MKILTFIISFIPTILFSQNTDNQSWNQLGSDLVGGPINKVTLSENGKILAVGFFLDEFNNVNSGLVRVFKYENDNWNQLGEDVGGATSDEQTGHSVSLSADGYTLAVGSPNNDDVAPNKGVVKVYTFNELESSWVQLGDNIYGTPYNNNIGYSTSLSSDGRTIAIGVPNNSNYFNYTGHVEIYRYDDANELWNQLGDNIFGEYGWDASGHSVSLSSNGNIIAIGAYNNWSNWPGSNTGHVRVYYFDGTLNNWIQLGNDIDGEFLNEWFGWRVSISSNGNILAIGSHRNSENYFESGRVSVFSFNNILNEWEQLGNDIIGDSEGDWTGYSVSLSASGYILAVSAPYDNQFGSVGVYSFESENNEWSLVGDKIMANDTMTNFGISSSLSRNGDTLSVSATNYVYGVVKSYFFQNLGCTDIAACNYDSTAITDNGSCLYSTNSSFDVIACESYEWNGDFYDTSGAYTFITTNSVGCDSIAILNLTISNSTPNVSYVASCENSFQWNEITFTNSGTYIYNSTNQFGCDSVSILHLTILNSTPSILDTTVCESSFHWNGDTFTSSGTYSYKTTNELGCDSISILDLTLYNKPDSIIIEQYWSSTLMTGEGFNYQWYLNDSPLLDENSSFLNFYQGGSYIVEAIDSVGCKIMSDPFVVGNFERSFDRAIDFIAYPNPTNNLVFIELMQELGADASIIVSDLVGQTLKTIELKESTSSLIDFSHFNNGPYLITVKYANGLQLSKTIIKN